MNYRPLLILLGEPYSVFIEILLKTHKQYLKKNIIKNPLVLIGSANLLKQQMKYFNYNFKIKIINEKEINKINSNKIIYIIDVDYKFKRLFEKKSLHSNVYIKKIFDISLTLLKKNLVCGMINGPISKTKFLDKKFSGITEYLSYLTKTKKTTMLIYNEKLSVCPITTHLPIKNVSKNISKKEICLKILQLNNFFVTRLNKKPKIAILGLNPHCESTDDFSEEDKIIKPAISYLKLKKVQVFGPFSADTFFLKKNLEIFDIVVGMYHDQVLTPAKTLFNFDAINITVGLPFIRISPDHGPNEDMVSKNISDPKSLIKSIDFFVKINAK